MGINVTNSQQVSTNSTIKQQEASTGKSDLESSIFSNPAAKRVYEYNKSKNSNMSDAELQKYVAKSFGLSGGEKPAEETKSLSQGQQNALNNKTQKFGEKFVDQLQNGTTFDNVNYSWNNKGEDYDKSKPNEWNQQASLAFSQGILNKTDNRGYWDKDTQALQDIAKTYDKNAEDIMKVADLDGNGMLTSNEYTAITAYGDAMKTDKDGISKNDGKSSEIERAAAMNKIFTDPEAARADLQKINQGYGLQQAYDDYTGMKAKTFNTNGENPFNE